VNRRPSKPSLVTKTARVHILTTYPNTLRDSRRSSQHLGVKEGGEQTDEIKDLVEKGVVLTGVSFLSLDGDSKRAIHKSRLRKFLVATGLAGALAAADLNIKKINGPRAGVEFNNYVEIMMACGGRGGVRKVVDVLSKFMETRRTKETQKLPKKKEEQKEKEIELEAEEEAEEEIRQLQKAAKKKTPKRPMTSIEVRQQSKEQARATYRLLINKQPCCSSLRTSPSTVLHGCIGYRTQGATSHLQALLHGNGAGYDPESKEEGGKKSRHQRAEEDYYLHIV